MQIEDIRRMIQNVDETDTAKTASEFKTITWVLCEIIEQMQQEMKIRDKVETSMILENARTRQLKDLTIAVEKKCRERGRG